MPQVKYAWLDSHGCGMTVLLAPWQTSATPGAPLPCGKHPGASFPGMLTFTEWIPTEQVDFCSTRAWWCHCSTSKTAVSQTSRGNIQTTFQRKELRGGGASY